MALYGSIASSKWGTSNLGIHIYVHRACNWQYKRLVFHYSRTVQPTGFPLAILLQATARRCRSTRSRTPWRLRGQECRTSWPTGPSGWQEHTRSISSTVTLKSCLIGCRWVIGDKGGQQERGGDVEWSSDSRLVWWGCCHKLRTWSIPCSHLKVVAKEEQYLCNLEKNCLLGHLIVLHLTLCAGEGALHPPWWSRERCCFCCSPSEEARSFRERGLCTWYTGESEGAVVEIVFDDMGMHMLPTLLCTSSALLFPPLSCLPSIPILFYSHMYLPM